MLERAAMLSPAGPSQGAPSACPHCNVQADVEPNAALGFTCRVCGGPRIALAEPSVALGPTTQAALVAAHSEHKKHLLLSASGVFFSGAGALGLLVALVVILAASPGVAVTLAALVISGVPLAAGLAALGRAARARALRDEALHAAQLSAVGDVQAVLGSVDAARAAQSLGIDPERAELLLAEASVAALLQPRLEPRLRIDIAPATSPSGGPQEALVDGADELSPSSAKHAGRTEI